MFPDSTVTEVIDPTDSKIGHHRFDSLIHGKIPHDGATIGISFCTNTVFIHFFLGKKIAEGTALHGIPQIVRSCFGIGQLASIRHPVINQGMTHFLCLHMPVSQSKWVLGVVRPGVYT